VGPSCGDQAGANDEHQVAPNTGNHFEPEQEDQGTVKPVELVQVLEMQMNMICIYLWAISHPLIVGFLCHSLKG